MKRRSLLLAALMLTGCGLEQADQFRRGFPQASHVKLEVPEKAGQALVGVERQELQGQRSGFYQTTRLVTVVVNGGTGLVLGLVKAITDHRPTSIQGKTAVWGPHTDALSPNTYKFTVTEIAPHEYEYALEGRGKSEPDSAFRKLLTGKHKPALDPTGQPLEHFGEGSFLLDWNEAQKLPEHDDNVGTAAVTYARLSLTTDTRIDVLFRQVKDRESGKLVDADYRYVAKPNDGGTFEFNLLKNIDNLPSRPALETMTIKSRWKQTGAGRSDVKAKGGDLQAEATANECWDESFNSQFLQLSFDPGQSYGSESVCAFTAPEYSSLSL